MSTPETKQSIDEYLEAKAVASPALSAEQLAHEIMTHILNESVIARQIEAYAAALTAELRRRIAELEKK